MKVLKVFLILVFLLTLSVTVFADDYLITKMSHNEAGITLRKLFPNAKVIGVEGDNFDVIPISEIEKILLKDKTDRLSLRDSGDYVMSLVGVFSRDYNKIPFGFIKTDTHILNIAIANGFDSVENCYKKFVYLINPKNDNVEKVYQKNRDARFVIIF
jgi:hypothetical protein